MVQRELTALVVDDDDTVRGVIVDILSRVPNLRIETASNGQEAYAKIKAQKPDILYTDIVMGNMNGDQLLEALVNEGIKIPTFVISATTVNEQAARTFHYSHQMYTEQQAAQLKLPLRTSPEEIEAYIERQMTDQQLKTYNLKRLLEKLNKDNRDAHTPFNLGFNVLTKPFYMEELLAKTNRVIKMLYDDPRQYTGQPIP